MSTKFIFIHTLYVKSVKFAIQKLKSKYTQSALSLFFKRAEALLKLGDVFLSEYVSVKFAFEKSNKGRLPLNRTYHNALGEVFLNERINTQNRNNGHYDNGVFYCFADE